MELKRSWEDGAINFNLGSVSNTAAVGDVYRYSGDGSLGGSYWYCYASGPASYLANPSLRAGVFYQLPTFNPDFGRDVAWHTPMGFVLGVWNGNPETDDPEVLPLSYEITDDGVRVFEDPGEAWFKFTTVPPALFGAPWSASTAYAIGDQVYYQSGNTGDFYNVIAATTAGIPRCRRRPSSPSSRSRPGTPCGSSTRSPLTGTSSTTRWKTACPSAAWPNANGSA